MNETTKQCHFSIACTKENKSKRAFYTYIRPYSL